MDFELYQHNAENEVFNRSIGYWLFDRAGEQFLQSKKLENKYDFAKKFNIAIFIMGGKVDRAFLKSLSEENKSFFHLIINYRPFRPIELNELKEHYKSLTEKSDTNVLGYQVKCSREIPSEFQLMANLHGGFAYCPTQMTADQLESEVKQVLNRKEEWKSFSIDPDICEESSVLAVNGVGPRQANELAVNGVGPRQANEII